MARRRWRLYRAAEPQRGPRVAVLLFVTFVLLVLVTRLVCNDGRGNSSFWPANGALVVAILILPPRLSLLTCLGGFAANLVLDLIPGVSLYENVLYSLLNVAMSYLAAFLTRSFCGAATDLSRARRLLAFSAISFVSAGAEAALGVALDPMSAQGARRCRTGFSGRSAMGLVWRLAHQPSSSSSRAVRRA